MLGRNASPPGPPLISAAIVIDGDWHQIGFVTDGSSRILYADGIEVARDVTAGLEPATGGLYMGAASTPESGTFFWGLIDDVRIYDTALGVEEIAALTQ